MSDYKAVRVGALALAVLCWALCTGLAIEKVLSDGVSSWTLLLAMPVLTAAVGILLHLGFQDLRDWRVMRGPVALALAIACLCVTLPASIGSSGQARDTALAEAKKSSDDLAKLKGDLTKAERLVTEAQGWAAEECKSGKGHRCEGIVFTLYQREAAAEKLRREVKGEHPKIANSGEHRIAWALGMAGLKASEADVAMIWPMLPPIAFELLCAFFLYAGLERRAFDKLSKAELAKEPATEAPSIVEISHNSGRFPEPPNRTKKRTKRQQRRERVIESIRRQTLAGKRPSFKLIKARHRLPNATASRWMKEAVAA